MENENGQSSNKSALLKPLGWIFGALSIINLLKELSPLKIYGLLAEWLEAYAKTVEKIRAPLFGWIEFGWISISKNDVHILVIILVFGAALARGSCEIQVQRGISTWTANRMAWRAVFIVLVLPVFLALVLFPYPFDIIAGFCIAAVLVVAFGFAIKEDDINVPESKKVRRELVGVASVVAIIIALNYSVFQKSSAEQDGPDQPAPALESTKSEGKNIPKPESEVHPQ